MNTNAAQILRDCLLHRKTARALVLKGADLRGIQLAQLRADGLDLREADLRECSLVKIKWKACALNDARLNAADFTEGVLRLCHLDQAQAMSAIFLRASLENSTATGARFEGADFTEAVLTDTDFSSASFRLANLSRIKASGANFRGADLTGVLLRDAELVDCDLRGADLTDADLDGADLHGADLRGAIGNHPALRSTDENPWEGLPVEMQRLSETMTPIVLEMLGGAGRRGDVDPEIVQRLVADMAPLQNHASPRNLPGPDTLEAVLQILDELGDNVLPALVNALRLPSGAEPPPEVQGLILRLREKFLLDETATAEDVLLRLFQGMK